MNVAVVDSGRLFVGGYLDDQGDPVALRVFDFSAPESSSAPLASVAADGSLGCSKGGWTHEPGKFDYQWLRDGAVVGGATAATYQPAAEDEGHMFACRVTATNEAGSATATSAAVAAPAQPQQQPGGGSTQPGGGGAGSQPARVTRAPRMKIARGALAGRVLKLTLACPSDETSCSGTVAVTAKGKRLGSAKFRIAGGKSKVVKVKLSPRLVKAGRIRLSVTLKAADAAGNAQTAVRKLALKAR
jgi:hypothetical protein